MPKKNLSMNDKKIFQVPIVQTKRSQAFYSSFLQSKIFFPIKSKEKLLPDDSGLNEVFVTDSTTLVLALKIEQNLKKYLGSPTLILY